MSAARKRLFYARVAYGRMTVLTTSAAVEGCFPNILWLVMSLPYVQQACYVLGEILANRL